MDFKRYYRRRKSFDIINLSILNALDLPFCYLGFIAKYHPLEITSLITDEPHGIGVVISSKFVKVSFLEADVLHRYEIDYGDSMYREDIVKIADNNIPEGGIYYDITDGCLYNLEVEPIDLPRKERKPIFCKVCLFFESLNLYKLSNSDTGFFERWELKVPSNKDDLVFPWEAKISS